MKKFYIVFFLSFLLLTQTALANENYPSLENVDLLTYSMVFKQNSGSYALLTSDQPLRADSKIYFNGTVYRYTSQDESWRFSSSSTSTTNYVYVDMPHESIVASDHDIYNLSGSSVFFSSPKDFLTVVKKIPILQNLILPIRGILPYLIPLVVLLVAFWKAWQFLLQQLRTA